MLIGIMVLLLPMILIIAMAWREGQRYEGRFGIGSALSTMFDAIGANPLPLLGLGVLLIGVPNAVLTYLLGDTMGGSFAATGQWVILQILLFVTATGFAWLVAAGIVTAWFEEGEASLSEALGETLRRLPMAVPVILCWALAVMVGMLFLVVPGVLIAVLWAFVIPVAAREDRSFPEVFGRSVMLTKGGRWRLLLLFIIVQLIAGLVNMLILAIAASTPWAVGMIAMVLLSGAAAALLPVLVAASYALLRSDKEGVASGDLETVFA